MDSEIRDYPRNVFAKKWNAVFSTDRKFKEDESYIDEKKKHGALGDDLHMFLQDSEDWMPSSKVEEIEEFCEGARLDNSNSLGGCATQRRAAWLDERSFRQRCARRCQNALTAIELYKLLKKPRYNNGNEPDVDRRLVCIVDLDPHYILALAKTVSSHQTSALRDGIWNHFTLEPLIKINIPIRGYPTFQLEFHLPFFAFRKHSPTAEARSKTAPGSMRLPRQCIDVSFLDIQNANLEGETQCGIYEAQVSLVICGSDEQQWIAYAFLDCYFNTEGPLDQEFSYDEIQEDPIAWTCEFDGAFASLVDANNPIWNPREYFLAILENQMARVVKEWKYVVRQLQRSVKQFESRHSSSQQSKSTGNSSNTNAKQTFEWTLRMSSLSNQLLDVISKEIKAWEGFISEDGDCRYFSDTCPFLESHEKNHQSTAHISLRSINYLFKTLESYQQTLITLEKSCKKTARNVQLRLARQSSEAVKFNGVTGGFASLVISPIMLASAVFCMPPHVIPVKVNFNSFVITALLSMAIINLLFLFLDIVSRQSSWWKGIVTRMKATELGGFTEMCLTLFNEWCRGMRSPRRAPRTSDEIVEDVEMTMGV